MKIYFPEITFSAAHYIPGHPQCGGLHGHTYFVRNLTIEIEAVDNTGMSIDFGLIKGYFKTEWDHRFIIPVKDAGYWMHIYEETGHLSVSDNRKIIKHTTAEWMAVAIRRGLGEVMEWNEIVAATKIHFDLYEGPNQAVRV